MVIAHGFAGSQQLMQPFALTLAKNGYVAVTFDFTGHGRNPVPMQGDVDEPTNDHRRAGGRNRRASPTIAKTLPESDGRIAVLGHSMASDIVVRYAQAHPEVEATVAVSVFSPAATATSPRNLLVIVGALEPAMLHQRGPAHRQSGDRRRRRGRQDLRRLHGRHRAAAGAVVAASNISACCTARTACAKRSPG